MKKLAEFLMLTIMAMAISYVFVMGFDKQAEINEMKAEQWMIQRTTSRAYNK